MELSCLIFFLYFKRELSEPKKLKKKKNTLKKFLICREMELSILKLKKLLYFMRELAKPEKQKFLIFQDDC